MMPGGFGRVLGSHVHENYGPVLGVPHDRVGDLGERMTTPIVSVDLLHSHVVLRPASYCGLRICTFFWDEHHGKMVTRSRLKKPDSTDRASSGLGVGSKGTSVSTMHLSQRSLK